MTAIRSLSYDGDHIDGDGNHSHDDDDDDDDDDHHPHDDGDDDQHLSEERCGARVNPAASWGLDQCHCPMVTIIIIINAINVIITTIFYQYDTCDWLRFIYNFPNIENCVTCTDISAVGTGCERQTSGEKRLKKEPSKTLLTGAYMGMGDLDNVDMKWRLGDAG